MSGLHFYIYLFIEESQQHQQSSLRNWQKTHMANK